LVSQPLPQPSQISEYVIQHATAKARGVRLRKPRTNSQRNLPLLELRFWVAPDVESGEVTLAWAEEARRDLEGCCVVFG
jgi:hypothetical protein